MAVDGGMKTIDNIQTNLVTVIPTNENSEFVLAKLWIDAKNDLIIKSQITTRSSGTVTVDYLYGAESEFGLPNQLVFDIDVKKFKLPKSVAADLNKTEKEKERLKKNKDQKGTIIIKLSNYKINKGINDDFFKEKN
jgi:outer membrane lipoprotein-sorting protein